MTNILFTNRKRIFQNLRTFTISILNGIPGFGLVTINKIYMRSKFGSLAHLHKHVNT